MWETKGSGANGTFVVEVKRTVVFQEYKRNVQRVYSYRLGRDHGSEGYSESKKQDKTHKTARQTVQSAAIDAPFHGATRYHPRVAH